MTISSFSVSPTSVVGGGAQVTATVSISDPAPVGGFQVGLTYMTVTGTVSNNLPILNLPSFIGIAAGQTSGSVTFTTNQVNYQWPGDPIATITASSFDGVTMSSSTVQLTVTSYGSGKAPGVPQPFSGTGVVGYPVNAQPANTQQSGNFSPSFNNSGALPQPNSNGNQSGTQIRMAKLNALNIGTQPPPAKN